MIWQVFPQTGSPNSLWSDWDTLNDKWHNSNPMLSSHFIALLCSYLKPVLYIAIATDGDKKRAMLLLEKCQNGIWQVFKPSQATLAFIVAEPASKILLQPLFKSLPGLACRIDFISLDPLEHQNIIALQSEEELIAKATNIRISVDTCFEQYWHERPKKLKANIKRYQNRLEEEQGKVRFVHLTSAQDVKSGTDRYGMLESKGWKGKLGTALHPANYQGQFYREFLCYRAEHHSALIIEMYVGEQLIASRLCCFNNGLLIALKTAFDETYKRYAVGRLLLKELIRWGFANPNIKKIDFYTNASAEQLEWSTEQRQMLNASLYAASLPGKLLSVVSRIKRQLTPRSNEVSED